ncbi:MAG: DinB family protein [Acidobacteria bacterium]|nr:DinB family protein [Acidobacteriota bacterium]MCA1609505.1 DinB family protein [Acidobacteriota bacterium]
MNSRKYFGERLKAERPAFLRVFQAIPAGEAGYRPHPRSMSAGDLVWLLADELHDACTIVERSEVNYSQKPAPAIEESIAAYERNAADLLKQIEGLDDAGWQKSARFMMDGKTVWEAPLGEMLWGFLFDAIHHRGQLSAYLRPMGGKVPSIYGPSGDDPGT